MHITSVSIEEAKKVVTYDLQGKENGWLQELFTENGKTQVYLTAANPGAFKGYHLHKVRAARYVCIKGTMKLILYVHGQRQEHLLSAENKKRLYIPPNTPTGLLNIGQEEAWLLNFPDPPYDPNLKGEQVDFTEEELTKGQP